MAQVLRHGSLDNHVFSKYRELWRRMNLVDEKIRDMKQRLVDLYNIYIKPICRLGGWNDGEVVIECVENGTIVRVHGREIIVYETYPHGISIKHKENLPYVLAYEEKIKKVGKVLADLEKEICMIKPLIENAEALDKYMPGILNDTLSDISKILEQPRLLGES